MTDAVKTSCYDNCPYRNRNCFGGYIDQEPLCDKEIARITTERELRFLPDEKRGLLFFDGPKIVCRLSYGWITFD